MLRPANVSDVFTLTSSMINRLEFLLTVALMKNCRANRHRAGFSWWEACGPRGVGSSLKLGEQVEAPEMGLGTRKFLYKWLVPVHF